MNGGYFEAVDLRGKYGFVDVDGVLAHYGLVDSMNTIHQII